MVLRGEGSEALMFSLVKKDSHNSDLLLSYLNETQNTSNPKTFDEIKDPRLWKNKYMLTKAPSVGAMARVAVSQTSYGVDPYNHPKGPFQYFGNFARPYVNQQGLFQNGSMETYGGGQPPSIDAMTKAAVSQTSYGVDPHNYPKGLSSGYVNQQGFQNGTMETYVGPSIDAMTKAAYSQHSYGVDPYNHPKGLSREYVNQQGFQNGTMETYGGGQPPSIDAMTKAAYSQHSYGVDP